ncbi:MAG: hypothetical protein ABR553_07675 [Gammaproteobacteria bacterium]
MSDRVFATDTRLQAKRSLRVAWTVVRPSLDEPLPARDEKHVAGCVCRVNRDDLEDTAAPDALALAASSGALSRFTGRVALTFSCAFSGDGSHSRPCGEFLDAGRALRDGQ